MIYFIEDDKSINEAVFYTLKSSGYDVKGFIKPSDFWNEIKSSMSPVFTVILNPGTYYIGYYASRGRRFADTSQTESRQ